MMKHITIALVATAALASAAPASAKPHHRGHGDRYSQAYNDRSYAGYQRGYGSATDRDGDGYDDRDRNFNRYIDPWEQGGSGRSYSATDRNGDGYDDRDTNYNRYIDPWERGGFRRR